MPCRRLCAPRGRSITGRTRAPLCPAGEPDQAIQTERCARRAHGAARARYTPLFSLESLGWNPFFEHQLTPADRGTLEPARVVEEQRSGYRVMMASGEGPAEISGRLRHETDSGATWPCVGDWVLARREGDGPAMIQRVLARRTQFSRRAAGVATREQVVAANADTVFVVQSLNRDLNLRRLERYLALIWESGAQPVVLLSKLDLCDDPVAAIAEVELTCPGAPVHAISSLTGEGLEVVRGYLGAGTTVAVVGSSGVGKSTLANALLGEERMKVQEIREDDRGKHTTTSRSLMMIPGGGLLMDTPGMRTVLLWDGGEGMKQVFGDIEEFAESCKFGDCSHETEPGCAVRTALQEGTITEERFRAYRKLQKEARYIAGKQDVAVRLAEEKKWRAIHRANRSRPDKRKI